MFLLIVSLQVWINMLQVSFRLKNADITPSFKRGDRNLKDNYRPVSISSIISKIFNDAFFNTLRILWSCCSEDTNVGSGGHITHNTVS